MFIAANKYVNLMDLVINRLSIVFEVSVHNSVGLLPIKHLHIEFKKSIIKVMFACRWQ